MLIRDDARRENQHTIMTVQIVTLSPCQLRPLSEGIHLKQKSSLCRQLHYCLLIVYFKYWII